MTDEQITQVLLLVAIWLMVLLYVAIQRARRSAKASADAQMETDLRILKAIESCQDRHARDQAIKEFLCDG